MRFVSSGGRFHEASHNWNVLQLREFIGAVNTVVEQILDLARWAPSGDNTQPWRFEFVADDHVVVHGFDTREHCVYDVQGRPSQMAHGALLENILIAATGHGLRASFTRRAGAPEDKPLYDVRFTPNSSIARDPLIDFITVRSVQRRAMRTRPLSTEEKRALEGCVAPKYRVVWIEGLARKWRAACLMWRNSKLRLICPEAYRVHRDVIEWNARYSTDRVPDQSLGLDPLTLKLMRPVMKSWNRVDLFNTYFGGTFMPRVQLDLIPALACGAHLAIAAERPLQDIDGYVDAGRAMQRFWLVATRLGLLMQPEMTPLIFATYVRAGQRFSTVEQVWAGAQRVRRDLATLSGVTEPARIILLGRIGAGRPATARSLRLEVPKLTLPKQ